MDKLREKYALHNKYRLSAAKSDESSTTNSTDASKEGKKNVNRLVEKARMYKYVTSSSATTSTASASFDSGETETKTSASISTSSDRTGALKRNSRIGNSEYQRLGSTSTSTEKDTSRSRPRSATLHQNRYHPMPPTNEDGHQRTTREPNFGHDGKDTKEGVRAVLAKITVRTESDDETLGKTRIHGTSRNNRTLQKNDQFHAVPPANGDYQQNTSDIVKELKSLGVLPEQSSLPTGTAVSPVRTKYEYTGNNVTTIQTPPRMAQSHGTVHMVPTEAQLRWAQFHRKKQAALTQERVEKLMKHPLHVQMVDGAQNGDGDCFSSEDEGSAFVAGHSDRHSLKNGKSVAQETKTRKKFALSRGRRALLRVSARRTEERRLHIKQIGYDMAFEDEESTDDEGGSSNHHSTTMDESLVFEDIFHVGDNSILFEDKSIDHPVIGNSTQRKKKKSSRKKVSGARRLKGMRSMVRTADEDEERMKRFEEAYTLMCSAKKSEDNIIKSSKRWSRDSDVPIAVSVDGRVYADLQRSPAVRDIQTSKRYSAEVVGAELNGMHLADRGATWMTHLPKQDRRRPVKFFGHSYTPTNEYQTAANFSNIISPSKMKLMEIAERIQIRKPVPSLTLAGGTHELPASRHEGLPYDAGHPHEIQTENAPDEVRPKKLSRNVIGESINAINVKNIRNRISQSFRYKEADTQEDSTHTDDDNDNDRLYEQKIQKIAAQANKSSNSVIDTDDHSDISDGVDALQQSRIASLMMSPTILSKRLNQAINAIELGHWDQVGYLILANSWLAEMCDVKTNQFLLHKLAFHGGGTISGADGYYEPAPKKLHVDLINASSAAIHKFDSFGNLPLHMAAEAGNKEMAVRLAKMFPGGASVRNNDGQLPLHLAILACANEMVNSALVLVSKILSLFPSALAIADNDGNLPLHLAAAFLTGDLGAEVIHLLVDEADRQGENLRFPNSIKTLDNVDDTMSNVGSVFDDSNRFRPEDKSVLSVKNAIGWNPLVTAIQRVAGFQVLDALLSRTGIESIVFEKDEFGQDILHLSIAQEYCDPASIISILNAFPDLVTTRDENGALPIEVACMRGLQSEIITAIALLDLPIDLDDDENRIRHGFGGSWWYLNCDCDDNYVHVVHEILEICDDYQQKRSLCFLKDKQGKSIMSRATPKCKHELRKTLRFAGRYEFVGSAMTDSDLGEEVKVFEALDFGTDEDPREDGRKVTIKYYGDKDAFTRAVSISSSNLWLYVSI